MPDSFQYSVGGATIIKVNPNNLGDAGGDGQANFDTCANRSVAEEVRMKSTCCNRFEQRGFNCYKRQIFPLDKNQCFGCGDYLAK
jgi:hypothetical protein